MSCSRRQFVTRSAFATLALSAGIARSAEKESIASAFDRAMTDFMRPRQIPGGALAVVRGKRLVYAQGYGIANRELNTPVRPNSLFRIASISKPFTAVAVLHLIEKGKLRLDQPVIPLLALSLCGKIGKDPRWQKITIQQLLQHTGGWDRDK
ncbi:MAG TPA: serine hydrolase domain-containing protein, partial [Candidatus Saccharimonadales bacterium]|nr:serine hydrolase domain-containing protein [Candidatus Saccharimonadales bacterium]